MLGGDIVLPKTVKRIDGRAFYSNSKLKSIKITGEEITMGELIFLGCNQLEKLTIVAQNCFFNFAPSNRVERSFSLFSYQHNNAHWSGGYDWQQVGSVPSGLSVTVKLETVKNKLVSPGGIPAGQIKVDLALE